MSYISTLNWPDQADIISILVILKYHGGDYSK